MSFDDLAPQSPINPEADLYAAKCLALSREAVNTTRCLTDIPYGSDPLQKLDLFMPDDSHVTNLPELVFFHGGGWVFGHKEWCGFMAPAITSLPAIFVSVSYRLIPAAAYPAAVKDAFAALRWVQDHVAEYGGSPERIFVGGHSAGGHIASLLTLREDWREEAGVRAGAIKACFCISTTFNRRMVNPRLAPDHVQKEAPADIAPESPLALASEARTPYFICWGDREDERMERTGTQMIKALENAGCRVAHEVLPGRSHYDIHLETQSPDAPWTRVVRRWMSTL